MKWFICIMILCISCVAKSQGIFQTRDDKPVSFKFELVNNVVLIPLTINGIAFSFLLDTGVKETLLFANAEDSLYLNNQNKMKFRGIGIEEGVDGILSTDNVVEVGGVAVDSLHWLYVIQGDKLDISSDIGVAINGILGSKFFDSFAVKVDYQKQRITLFPPDYNYERSIRQYNYVPLTVENERPYITANMLIDTTWVEGKMLMDMGNTAPLMLFAFLLPDFHIKEPYVEEYIGRGFNGAVYGKRNRIRKVTLDDFILDYPIVAYPDSNALFMSKLAENRIGSVGNQVLQRFHLLIDYRKNALYLRKNKKFAKPFLLNMAGIEVRHDGMIWKRELVKTGLPQKKDNQMKPDQGVTINLANDAFQYKFVLQPTYRIAGIRKDSPAEKAGIQADDMLLKVNGKSTGRLTLPKIMEALQSRPGETLRLTLQRGDEQYDARFLLVDPIPFYR
ncbi:PDZ domain-containing protein [Sphingobacterium sp. SGR-19]|uniref:PDZ domain-containing protein n=1 Tax=Sphingobacterium sp. SGR-19 TaxID=2710886 RepID=UPI0013ECF323|nr:PDZ domain-containing protein [Sphingobacterium sp. SGR-19]NGM63898.1 PDZ domain-containing protein [Sphingobacterium sp. SGR-19]